MHNEELLWHLKGDNMKMKVVVDGDGKKLSKWLDVIKYPLAGNNAHTIGRAGVAGLRASTPKDTGNLAASWNYTVRDRVKDNGVMTIEWSNPVTVGRNQTSLVALKQFGHATRDGQWIPGIDFVNPPISKVSADAGNMVEKVIKRS
jgi:hypothetical protein